MENPFPPATRLAYQQLKALTKEQRALILCWFCPSCGAYLEPGKGECRDCEPERAIEV